MKRILAFAIALVAMPLPVVSQETLVISAILECRNCGPSEFSIHLLELTACTAIANLSQYSFISNYTETSFSPTQYVFIADNGQPLMNIPAGTRIYVSSGDAEFTTTFFGQDFGNRLFISSATNSLDPFLTANYILQNSTTVVDSYGALDLHSNNSLDNAWLVHEGNRT